MRLGFALVLALLAPSAIAGVPFVADYEDPRGDIEAPSADIVRVTSSVAADVVTQRVEMAAPPDAARDTMILRSWFHDSTNGSFDVVDLETHAAADWRAIVRRDAFENVTPIEDATFAIEGNSYVFTFPAALVEDATCFDPIVWAQHRGERGPPTIDVGGVGARACKTRGDPPATPGATSVTAVSGAIPGAPTTSSAPPGSRMPPIGGATLVVVAGLVGVAVLVGIRNARGPKR